jgi:hypothetical protein
MNRYRESIDSIRERLEEYGGKECRIRDGSG